MHVPVFFKRQVFVKFSPGDMIVPSGIVMSSMNCAVLQFEVGGTTVGGMVVFIGGEPGVDDFDGVT